MEEDKHVKVMVHYHPQGSKDHGKDRNRFGTGQRPKP
jgi:hypothetical protein